MFVNMSARRICVYVDGRAWNVFALRYLETFTWEENILTLNIYKFCSSYKVSKGIITLLDKFLARGAASR